LLRPSVPAEGKLYVDELKLRPGIPSEGKLYVNEL